MSEVISWKRGDPVLAYSKGAGSAFDTFSSQMYEARILKVYLIGGRFKRHVFDLRFSNDNTKEYGIPLVKNGIKMVIRDDDPARGDTEWEYNSDSDSDWTNDTEDEDDTGTSTGNDSPAELQPTDAPLSPGLHTTSSIGTTTPERPQLNLVR